MQTKTSAMPHSGPAPARGAPRYRGSAVVLGVGMAFAAVGVQLLLLAANSSSDIVVTLNEPIGKSYARPDILDRNGRLMATDVEMPSLFADPSLVTSRDDTIEQLTQALPGADENELRRVFADRTRRFAWIRRGLSPKVAQVVHDLGLPGLAFRDELRRAYPLETLAGHVLGQVNIDNRGVAGLERYLDEAVGVETVHSATLSSGAPLRLALDIGVQHSLEDELRQAMSRYEAKGAAGLVMDVASGEMLASASLPGIDPLRLLDVSEADRLDKIQGGTYELGSIFKTVTIGMALEGGKVTADTVLDVTQPLVAGRFTITDSHPVGRPLSVAEVFIHSSNVGAGMLALDAGAARQRAFLDALGLTDQMRTEAGPVAPPQLPQRFERAEQITVSYGHGIAVAPIQFAAAAAALINGGQRVTPTYLRRVGEAAPRGQRVVSEATSKTLRDLFRRNVTDPHGTGKRADVPGYRVGGKTGTAEIPGRGGYNEKAVLSSFLAAFPMDAPRFLVLVSLFEPTGNDESGGEILAGRNAAPTAARVISRIAPMLGVLPDGTLAALPD